jgi:integrase
MCNPGMKMPTEINFTKKNIESISAASKRMEYKDTKIPELRLRVSPSGTKSFCVYKRLPGGKPVRITLGKYPNLAPDRARVNALKQLAELSEGVNPNEQRRIDQLSLITLKEAYQKYLESKDLKPKTKYGYDSVFNCHLDKLHEHPLKLINREVIAKTHRGIQSKAQADLTMRVLRAVFNFSKGEFLKEDGSSIFPENPVDVLSHRKQWNNVGRKQTHIRKSDLSRFFNALEEVKNKETLAGQSICDAMLFALLTGLRKNEVFSLQWDDVNMEGEIFTIFETKNDQPLELPLTPYIYDIFLKAQDRVISQHVFGSDNSYGQIKEPKKVVAKVKLLSATHCDFHDLRRTFATIAEHEDIGTYKLKRLMNHTTGRDDVTAGYTILTAETLRGSAMKIQSAILRDSGYLKAKLANIKHTSY